MTARKNMAASVSRRLLNYSHERGIEYNLVLLRFLNERLLYRLGRSAHREQFIVKGAMTFDLWLGPSHRPTRDIDLLGSGSNEPGALAAIFREIFATAVEDDGLVFDAGSIEVEAISEGDRYEGVRIRADVSLGSARLPLRIDVGFGDAVTPDPVDASFPTLLDLPAPSVRAYPRETIIAEKFEAIVSLGMANTRLKDFYDIWLLAALLDFDGTTLRGAVAATFKRRGTKLQTPTLVALLDEFSMDPQKQEQWKGFLRRTGIDPITDLVAVVAAIKGFLLPVLANPNGPGTWSAGSGRWQP